MMNSKSFHSYIDEDRKTNEKNEKLSKAFSKVYEMPDLNVQNNFLDGEVTIGYAKKVIRYNTYDDPSKGISGALVCTNFRLSFMTAEKPKFDLIELQNRLLKNNDIALNNIDSIFVEYSNKRKKLIPGSKVKDGIQRMEIHCKDFRIVSFNFKLTVKGEEKILINSILHHAYPATVMLLFAFDYQHKFNPQKDCRIPLYRESRDWETMLHQCKLSKSWRVTSINSQFISSSTMGGHFVVPAKVSDGELSHAAHQFQNDRLPMWCWGDANGCSLVRSAHLHPETELQYWEDKLFEGITKSDPNERSFKIVEIDKSCPSCLQIQQAFRKLKNLSMPTSQEEFWDLDSHWFNTLHASKWLQYVSMLLTTAREAAKWIREDELHVILRESSGIDLTPVISSLVQLMLDPTSRTLDGFQSLIQREWVVGGHPFLDRLGHLLQPTKKSKQTKGVNMEGETTHLAPIFLIFLDCVYQLQKQFPSRFEFNSTFLTVLLDSTRITAFETFLFNNEKQRTRFKSDLKEKGSSTFLPLWCWQLQFTDKDMTLFNNPLYKLRMSENYCKYSDASRILFSPSVSPKKPLRKAPQPPPNAKKPPPLPSNPKPSSTAPSESKPPVAPKRNKPRDLQLTSFSASDAPSVTMYQSLPSPGSPRLKTKQTVDVDYKKIHDHNTNSPKTQHQRNRSEDISKFSEAGRRQKQPMLAKQGSSLERQDSPRTPPSRSKSEGNLFDDDDAFDVEQIVREPPIKSPGKKKTRFSLRRKKSKDYGSNEALSNDEYKVTMQKISTLERHGGVVEAHAPSALYPCTCIASIKLWKECYLRWLPWSQLFGGGPAATLQQQSLVFDEIHILNNKVRELKQKLGTSPVHTESCHRDYAISGVYFCMHPTDANDSVFPASSSLQRTPSSPGSISSYFPYSPLKDLRRNSILGTPLNNFLQGGSLFNFGKLRTKLVNSSADISVALPKSLTNNGNPDTSQSSDALSPSGASSVSLDNLTYEPWGHPEVEMRNRTQTDGYMNYRSPAKPSPPAPPPASLKPTTTHSQTENQNITYITSL